MGETKNLHFYDFAILGRVQTPSKPTISFFGDTRTTTNLRNICGIFENMIFINLKTLESSWVVNLGKDGHRTFMKIRLINPEILGYEVNMHQYLLLRNNLLDALRSEDYLAESLAISTL